MLEISVPEEEQRLALRRIYAAALAPRAPVAMETWITRNIVMPKDSPKPGPFRHLVPAAGEIMQALQDPDVNTVAVRGPVQMMKTTLLINSLLYFATEKPASVLVFEPDDGLSELFLTSKLDPIARQIEDISKGFEHQPQASRKRIFPGGRLDVLSGLAENPEVMRTAKYIFIDEYRSFKKDLYQSIRGRMTLYSESGGKIYATSSAGEHGACRITQLLEQSDQREWRVPCRDCGVEQVLNWESVEWRDDDSETAVYVCTHCHYKMLPHELRTANVKGRWVATSEPDRPGIVGFDCNFMASPFVGLNYGVAEFIAANRHMKRTGSEEQLASFYRDYLAEPYRPGAGMKPEILARKCRAPYREGNAPDWVSNVVLTVDVQDDRLEYEFSGWAAVEVPAQQDAHRLRQDPHQLTPLTWNGKFYQFRRAGLQYGRISGDPGLNAVWEELNRLRCSARFSVGGRAPIGTSVGLVDTGGHHTSQVKAYVNRVAMEYATGAPAGCQIYASKGASQPGQPLVRQSMSQAIATEYAGYFVLLGVDGAKEWCHAMLRASRFARQKLKPAVYPAGDDTAGYDLSYFQSLCAEKKEHFVNRYGQVMIRWVKDKGTPNEALDLYAYSLAGAYLIGIPSMLDAGEKIKRRLETAKS